jgi:glycosyltransferase involved in cell wall biosynthesis
MKKASIVIVNYNDKLRVERSINSALNQTWSNVEVILVDDGSDKETRVLYEPFRDKIKLIQLERDDPHKRTVPGALNAGLKASTGDYISILDSDDYIDKCFVEKLIKAESDIAICNWKIIGKQTALIEIEKVWNFNIEPLKNYLKFNRLCHSGMLVTREVLDAVGLYDERLPRSQDCDRIVRTMMTDFKWKHIKDVLLFVDKHENDQMKTYASIHGKTLWSLKNNINIEWLMGILVNSNAMGILAFWQGIKDFMEKPEWKDDYEKSDFKKLHGDFGKVLDKERSE